MMVIIFSTPICLRADDTEIYGTVTSVDLEPNVLIVFDSSGSMDTQDVPGDPYDPNTTFSGSYETSSVYYRKWSWLTWSYVWSPFLNDVGTMICGDLQSDLLSQGWAEGYIRTDSSCGGSSWRKLRLGNYLNYIESGVGAPKRRIDVAKEVITALINDTTGVRFGVMRFNYDEGGRLIGECGTAKQTLIDDINAITPDGYTPLAETLAEAGLYFAGKPSWFNSGVTYTSPMQERCQKNYIIVMTDGYPRQDRDLKLTTAPYINGDIIGDYDSDHSGDEYTESDGSDYLDDVAKYLYENDCHPTLGDGTSFDNQNIVTFTIGFNFADSNQILIDTASNGGGEFYSATNISELSEAFQQIMTSISEENAVFVAPVVPISRMNRTYAGDRIYLGFFKPQQSGRWIGNIKRYALDTYGVLYDATGGFATTPDGLIKENALSFWTTLGIDGPNVAKGGTAEVLNLRIESTTPRNLYTYTESTVVLTDGTNAFDNANVALTNSALNVASDTERQSLIESVHNGVHGDIIHSEPVVVHYLDPDGDPGTDDAKTMIYTGANDGILHCFDDYDGSEVWGLIPPQQLGRLSLLNNADHDYFMDGTPAAFYFDTQTILIMGERRGGSHYSVLDITTYNSPRWLYSIGPDILDPDPSDPNNAYESLGQSWSRPEKATIATGVTVTTETPVCGLTETIEPVTEEVFLLGGGYDNNQDLQTPNFFDFTGRAVFAVKATTGTLTSSFKFNAVEDDYLYMTHSIVEVSGFDHDGDGIVSRIYAGDLGGNIFAFKDDAVLDTTVCGETVPQMIVDGVWMPLKLFSASSDGVQRKILYAPDAVEESFGEYIFFGTGDRSDPGETRVVNRMYAVKNDWTAASVLTESDLVDVTDDLIQLGSDTEKEIVKDNLENKQGWYIRLENTGEKIVASPRVFGGVVYFTTYTPSPVGGGDPDDPCASSTVRGIARLYAVNYKTGASVQEFSSETETDAGGNSVDLGKKDRSIAIGTAIPSAPVIAVLEGGAQLFVGVEGGIVSLPVIATQDMYRYYWHQKF
jgi:type IV pilus assembly protein PilY1